MTRVSSSNLRLATAADNEQLIDLARRCPINGHLAFYSDRYPDFFALLALQGDKSKVYVVENEGGKIVACAAITEKTVRWGDRLVKALHFGDLRTDPEYRGSRAALKLIKIYDETLLTGDYHHGLVEFAGGSVVSKAQKYLSGDVDVLHDGTVRMFQLPPVRRYPVSDAYHFRSARAEDIPEISRLLRDTHTEVSGAPSFTETNLEALLLQHPSFTIDKLWLAVNRKGEIAACAGLWDQTSVRQIVATKFTKAAKLTVRALSLTGLIWKLPPLPKVGQALRYQVLRWPSARREDSQALAQLLRFLLNKVRLSGDTSFLTVGFHEHDPLVTVLDGLFKVEDQVELYSHRVKAKHALLPKIEVSHHFIDLSLV